MKNSDVLIFMKKLSPDELSDLTKYLKKQFQKDSIPLRLYYFLKKYYPDFEHERLSFEYVHRILFQDKVFKKKYVQNTLSDLRQSIRDFFIKCYLDENPIEKDILLLRIYNRRQFNEHFSKYYNRINKALENDPQQDMWYWLNYLQLEHEKYFNVSTKRLITRKSMFRAMESLDLFYAASKLKYASEVINGRNLVKEKDRSVRFLKEIESADWCNDFASHLIYKKVLPLVRERTTETYDALKNYFKDNYQKLHTRDQFTVLTYLLNHASTEVRRGNNQFNFEVFELMKFGIVNSLFIVDDVFDTNHFMNIVTIASSIGEFEWAIVFVEEHAEKLNFKQRDYYRKYCEALILFHRRNFANCAEILTDINLKEPQDEYRGRWLKIIADYETYGSTDELDKQCEAFYQFVRRNKLIPEEKKDAMLLAYKVFKKLLDPNTTKAQVENFLEHSSNFYYKSWIDEKVKLLK